MFMRCVFSETARIRATGDMYRSPNRPANGPRPADMIWNSVSLADPGWALLL